MFFVLFFKSSSYIYEAFFGKYKSGPKINNFDFSYCKKGDAYGRRAIPLLTQLIALISLLKTPPTMTRKTLKSVIHKIFDGGSDFSSNFAPQCSARAKFRFRFRHNIILLFYLMQQRNKNLCIAVFYSVNICVKNWLFFPKIAIFYHLMAGRIVRIRPKVSHVGE